MFGSVKRCYFPVLPHTFVVAIISLAGSCWWRVFAATSEIFASNNYVYLSYFHFSK